MHLPNCSLSLSPPKPQREIQTCPRIHLYRSDPHCELHQTNRAEYPIFPPNLWNPHAIQCLPCTNGHVLFLRLHLQTLVQVEKSVEWNGDKKRRLHREEKTRDSSDRRFCSSNLSRNSLLDQTSPQLDWDNIKSPEKTRTVEKLIMVDC